MERMFYQALSERDGNGFDVALLQAGEMRQAEHSAAEFLRDRQGFAGTILKCRLPVASGAPPGSGFNTRLSKSLRNLRG